MCNSLYIIVPFPLNREFTYVQKLRLWARFAEMLSLNKFTTILNLEVATGKALTFNQQRKIHRSLTIITEEGSEENN